MLQNLIIPKSPLILYISVKQKNQKTGIFQPEISLELYINAGINLKYNNGDHGIPSLYLISMFLLSYIGSLFLTLSFLSNGRHQQVTHSVIGKFYHIYSTRFYLPQNIFSTP